MELDEITLRKLQKTELELLLELDAVCKKNDIKYSLDGGTLLGAVRHRGFIPWDDDADVMMTRTEYEKFFLACKKDLNTEKYFLQEFRTDKDYRWGYSKLRKNGTIFLREGQEHIKCHTGVCIDVFVFDNAPDNPIVRPLYLLSCFLIRKGLYSAVGRKKEKQFIKKLLYTLLNIFPREIWDNYYKAIRGKNNKRETELMSHYTYPNRKKIKYGLKSLYWKDYVRLEFEGHEFMVIKNYKEYLTDLFDDYMKLPDAKDRKTHPVSIIRL